MEEWRDIEGYEGYYQVSNKGRLKSLSRKFVDSIGRNQHIKERIIRLSNDKDGYKIALLHKKNIKKNIRIHRLVAEAFISNPDNKPQTNHRDGDKTNNRVNNLEWCTSKENINHSWKIGNSYVNKGEKHYNSIIAIKDVYKIRSMFLNGMNQKDIAKMYNVHQVTISDIVSARTWRHLGIHKIISDRKGENAGCVKLTEKNVIDIKTNYKKGVNKMSDFARKYNVDVRTIQCIISGKNWKHVMVP